MYIDNKYSFKRKKIRYFVIVFLVQFLKTHSMRWSHKIWNKNNHSNEEKSLFLMKKSVWMKFFSRKDVNGDRYRQKCINYSEYMKILVIKWLNKDFFIDSEKY